MSKPLIPYPDRKVIDGASYYLAGGTKTKKEADDLAERMRAKGDLVRIIKPKSRKLPKYMVYARHDARGWRRLP